MHSKTFLLTIVLAISNVAAQTVLYEQGFEGTFDKPTLATDSKKYTIHFQGVTEQRKVEGKKSYKIDVTFEDGTYFYLMFETGQYPVTDGMTVQASVFLESGGQAGLGHNFTVPASGSGGGTIWKLWAEPTNQWQSLTMDGHELRIQGEETCLNVLRNPDVMGLTDDYLPLYHRIEGPVYDAWYVNIRSMKGRRVVLYVDDVSITSEHTREDLENRQNESGVRFEQHRAALVERLESDLAAAHMKAQAVVRADALRAARWRNELEQSQTKWGDVPKDLHEWLLWATAVGQYGKQIDSLKHQVDPPPAKRKQTDALVFAVPPILAPEELPDPGKLPDMALRRESIKIAVCPGEVEFGSFCVYAGRQALEDVTIRITDLYGADDPADEQARNYFAALPEPWKFKPDPDDEGMAGNWFQSDFDDSGWSPIRTDMEKGWDGQGFVEQRVGYGWYRQRLAANPRWSRFKHRYLYFQAVDEQAYVYLNGKLIFQHTERATGLPIEELWIKPFAVKMNGIWSGEEDASLVVRVHNRQDLGGIWKPVYLVGGHTKVNDEQMKSTAFAKQTRPAYTPPRSLAAERFDPYIVQWWYRGEKPEETRWQGELLAKDPTLVTPDHERKENRLKYATKEMRDAKTLQPTSLAAGQGVQYFLIARIAPTTPSGKYAGHIDVLSQGAIIARVPVDMTVLPFSLAESLLDYTIYYRGGKLGAKPAEYAPVDSEYKTDAQLEADVADMLDHGIKHPFWYCAHHRILKLRRKFAMTGTLFTIYPSSPTPDATGYINWSANVIEQLRVGGCDPIYISGPDEPNVDAMARTRLVIDTVHRLLGVRVMAAVAAPLTWENLRHHLDLPILAHCSDGITHVSQWHGDGKPAYVYGVGLNDGSMIRKGYGLDAWQKGYDGVAPYAYQHASGDPWDALSWQWNFAWPTADGRISTIQWEALRAAVSDVRYASTLVKWLGRTASILADDPVRRSADKTLAMINPDGDLDIQRANIIDQILALKSAMARGTD